MDRALSEKTRRIRRRKQLLRISFLLILLFLIFFVFVRLISPTIRYSKLLLSTARNGDIEATLNAFGTIQPEFEEIISCPIHARIENIKVSVGSEVDSGQSIIKLNKETFLTDYRESLDQLEMLKTQYSKSRLALNRNVSDLETQLAIKDLENRSLNSALEDATRLYEIGGGTEEEVEQARMNYEVGVIKYDQLVKHVTNAKDSRIVELREAELNIRIQERKVEEMERKLQQSDIYAQRKGVVTWVKSEVGSDVNPGEVIARVADLTSYKVEARISDLYIDKLYIGQQVIARVNEAEIRGYVALIHPEIASSQVSFTVMLDKDMDVVLRPQKRVDVFLVIGQKEDVLLVGNGPAFSGAENQILFVLQNGKAVRRQVITGVNNYDNVEIVEGINEGDQVIISDMKKYKKRKKVKVR